jgi:hypothetical protein
VSKVVLGGYCGSGKVEIVCRVRKHVLCGLGLGLWFGMCCVYFPISYVLFPSQQVCIVRCDPARQDCHVRVWPTSFSLEGEAYLTYLVYVICK